MSEKYNFTAIEKKWQRYWDEHNTFRAGTDYSKPKFYALVEFPYPSGQGLHIGHPRPYTAMDIVSRKRRLEGYNVLFPMGWDAFGLPTENYAIKNKIHPAIVTEKNIAHFKEQLKMLGLSFDWEREVNTTSPEYYKWTQWIFLQMFKKGLAYKKEMAVNWCTSCKVVLANEEELRRLGLQSMTEVKFENSISRATAVANPRQIERVVRGSVFKLDLIYELEEEQEFLEDMETLAEAMKLLQYDYLGGNGSRGYGKIQFQDIYTDAVVGHVDNTLLEKCNLILNEAVKE